MKLADRLDLQRLQALKEEKYGAAINVHSSVLLLLLILSVIFQSSSVYAQHVDDNAVTSADDAFGNVVGHESIGLYDDSNVRGFSPATAANFRIQGMYFDAQGNLSDRVLDSETIRVGLAAQGYAFPAPTGIADLVLRGSGDKLGISPILSTDSYGSVALEVDSQIPLIDNKLSTALGFGLFRREYPNGGNSKSWNFGVVPRWRPSKGVEVISFFNREQTYGETAQGIYLPSGDFLPNRVPRAIYPGPFITVSNYYTQTFGTLARASLGDWTLRGGVFRSFLSSGTGYSNNIYVNPNMSTDRQVEAFPASINGSWSGEMRASRLIHDGKRKHLVTVSLRGRDILNEYGGGGTIDFGAATLTQVIRPTRPDFALGPLTQDRTHQATLGVSYGLEWAGLAQLTLGLQRTRYIKAVQQPGLAFAHRVDNVSLPSVSAAIPLPKDISLYGSIVRGLEDAGAAPNYAANPGVVLPAIRTRQYDAGMKWRIVKGTTLIIGWYDISKPYINLDSSNIYRVLGNETHRGIEASLTTTPASGLTMVFGGLFARPRVVADASLGQPIGVLPVGQYAVSTRFNVDYALPFVKAVTLDGYINYDGPAAGTVDNKVMVPGALRFGIGSRYKFKLDGKRLTLRISVNNLTNNFTWVPIGSGAYVYNQPRNVKAYIAADF